MPWILTTIVYNPGLGHGKSQIGLATAKTIEEVGVSKQQYAAWKETGFYAVAYDVPGLGTVISYRGTDEELKDAWNGWSSIVGGVPEQARLAAQFYNSVRKDLDEIAFCRLQHTI